MLPTAHIVLFSIHALIVSIVQIFYNDVSPLTRNVMHGASIVVATAGLVAVSSWPVVASVHNVAGLLVYLAMIGSALLGSLGGRMHVRQLRYDRYIVCAALPFVVLSGVVSAVGANDTFANLAAATLIVVATGYSRATLGNRAYLLLGLEAISIALLGFGALLVSIAFERNVMHIATACFVALVGLSVLWVVRRRALDKLLVPLPIAVGAPLATLASWVALVLVSLPARATVYASSGATVTSAALVLAAITRLLRATTAMAVPLSIAASSAFATQLVFETAYGALHEPFFLWWAIVIGVGAVAGFIILLMKRRDDDVNGD